MNVTVRLHTPRDREAFLAWAEEQDDRYEFDGSQPVVMVGGTQRHNWIAMALHRALYVRLRDTGCRVAGLDVGVATGDNAVRLPDAVVTCTPQDGSSRLVTDPLVVFEILSPTSGRADRIEKVREYRSVPSIRRYVILEQGSIGLTSLSRTDEGDWTALTLMDGDTLDRPEIGIDVPVSEFYDGAEMPSTEG